MAALKYPNRLRPPFADGWKRLPLCSFLIMFAVTITAVAAVVAAFQPIPHEIANSATGTRSDDRQVIESTRRICDAYARVTDAVEVNNSVPPSDGVMREMMAVGQRQVFIISEAYLSDMLEISPVIPDQLTTAVNRLISSFKSIVEDSFLTDSNLKKRSMIRDAANMLNGICIN